ncbi:M56 family metallopeptidase [Paenibacillus sp. FSL R7-0048]|uniref:M56 family metallopeptidase n=1 Tax=Paenibacillus TaxID=44249 RepID=UPI00096BF900|nr:M56 family metallopeptidase [Paenibacillus odorifer]OMD98524.1 hypothetical protein BSK64_27710 [Paenibacillus odorifer]
MSTFMNMSFTAAVMIVAIIVIRSLVINKLPKKTFMVLWGVVVYRLLIPFSLPSPFSIYTWVDSLPLNNSNNVTFVNPSSPLTLTMNLVGSTSTSEVQSINNDLSFAISSILVIWIMGMVISALYFIITYVKCRREFHASLPVDHPVALKWLDEHKLTRTIQIRQLDLIRSPLTYGIKHPVILLPKNTDWSNIEQIQYILMHELVHIRRFDQITKLILTAVLCVHWFNPLVWVMYMLANRDIEHSCDETVVRSFGETTKRAYAMSLITMEERKNKLNPLSNHFSKNAIEERIMMIMKMKKTTTAATVLAIVLVVGATAVFATSSAKSAGLKTNQDSSVLTRGDNDNIQYSTNGGKTWMSQVEYEAKYPVSDVEWWTYDEYKAWLEDEKIELPKIIGGKAWTSGDGWFTWTQKRVDDVIARYEKNLADIKNGTKISKTVNGQDDMMLSSNATEISTSVYSETISSDNGEVISFGPFDTKEELLAKVKPYCEQQVKQGNMTQREAKEILSKYN